MACAALICKAAKKTLSKKLLTGPALLHAVPPLIFCNYCSRRISVNRMYGYKKITEKSP